MAKHGDFSIGTLNGLNGEMIALYGKFYQILVAVVPREVGLSEKTPFATVSFFENDFVVQVENVYSYLDLTSIINSAFTNYNLIYVIRVHGYLNLLKQEGFQCSMNHTMP